MYEQLIIAIFGAKTHNTNSKNKWTIIKWFLVQNTQTIFDFAAWKVSTIMNISIRIVFFYIFMHAGLCIYEDDLRHRFELYTRTWKNRGSDPFHKTFLGCFKNPRAFKNYNRALYYKVSFPYLLAVGCWHYLSKYWQNH